MKYIYIMILLSSSIIFTGCFEKPVETDVGETANNEIIIPTPEEDTIEVFASGAANLDDDTMEKDEESEQETGGDEETNSGETTQEVVPAASGSSSEQAIIEEYEQDLEELFNDILGS